MENVIKLDRPGYFCQPDVDGCNAILERNGVCVVRDFVIWRQGYGKIVFPGDTDLTGIDLDEVVHISHKQVSLYPNDEPPVGCGLNKPAIVTLVNVFPTKFHDGVSLQSQLSVYARKVEAATSNLGARFIDYKPDTGSWVFQVEHFSKFHLDDSDDDETDSVLPTNPNPGDTFVVKPGVRANGETYVKDNSKSRFSLGDSTVADSELGNTYIIKKQNISRGLGGLSEEDYTSYSRPGVTFGNIMEEDEDAEDVAECSTSNNYSLLPSQLGLSTASLEQMSSLFPSEENITRKRFAITENNVSITSNFSKKHRSGTSRADWIVREEREKMQREACGSSDFQPHIEPVNIFTEDDVLTDDFTRLRTDDSGVGFKSRFRASWTSNNALVCPLAFSSSSQAKLFEKQEGSFKVGVSEIFKTPDETKDLCEHLLDIQLEHSVCSFTDNPLYIVYQNAEFTDALTTAGISLQALDEAVTLCKALFGNHDKLAVSDNKDSYEQRQCRREAFSDWLSIAANKESFVLPKGLSKQELIFFKILLHLTSNQKAEATDLALSANLCQLALLTAQNTNLDMQKCLSYLLQEWEQNGVVDYQGPASLKVYGLLSGHVSSPSSGSQGFNVCEGLGWKRCLGAHFWFTTFQNSSLGDAIDQYQDMFRGDLATWPLPLHASGGQTDDNRYLDSCYHLIRLFMDSTYSIELSLNPLSFSNDISDYTSSWFLLNVLQSLGYVHLDEKLKLSIASNFAAQLEQCGSWHWAVFVLAFITADVPRKHAIQSTLDRNCSYGRCLSDKESLVVEKLHIDSCWVYKSKALKAKLAKDDELQLKHLLEAKCFEEAHELLMSGLAGELFFDQKTGFLISCLDRLSNVDLLEWPTAGGVIHEYFRLHQLRQQLEDRVEKEGATADLAESLNVMHCAFLSLSQSLKKMKLSGRFMKLLVSEIAESVVQSIRLLDENNSFESVVPLLADLPLMQDSARYQMSLLAASLTTKLSTD